SERPAQFKCAAGAVARLPKCYDLIPPFGPRASVSSIDVNHDNVTARRPDGTRVPRLQSNNLPWARSPCRYVLTIGEPFTICEPCLGTKAMLQEDEAHGRSDRSQDKDHRLPTHREGSDAEGLG